MTRFRALAILLLLTACTSERARSAISEIRIANEDDATPDVLELDYDADGHIKEMRSLDDGDELKAAFGFRYKGDLLVEITWEEVGEDDKGTFAFSYLDDRISKVEILDDDSLSSVVVSYDADERTQKEVTEANDGKNTSETEYEYDEDGQLDSIKTTSTDTRDADTTFTTTQTVSFDWNDDHTLASVDQRRNTKSKSTDTSLNASFDSDVSSIDYRYDDDGRLDEVRQDSRSGDTDSFTRYELQYSPDGLVEEIRRTKSGSDNTRTFEFKYTEVEVVGAVFTLPSLPWGDLFDTKGVVFPALPTTVTPFALLN